MKVKFTTEVKKADVCAGEFNNCEHLFLECEAGKYQTISVRLPNDEFVTFAFIPSEGNEMECVDIHSTVGQKFTMENTVGRTLFVQALLGFAPKGRTSFDTRQLDKPTTLVTLLLSASHNKAKEGNQP